MISSPATLCLFGEGDGFNQTDIKINKRHSNDLNKAQYYHQSCFHSLEYKPPFTDHSQPFMILVSPRLHFHSFPPDMDL
jgi:hypothetical protein